MQDSEGGDAGGGDLNISPAPNTAIPPIDVDAFHISAKNQKNTYRAEDSAS